MHIFSKASVAGCNTMCASLAVLTSAFAGISYKLPCIINGSSSVIALPSLGALLGMGEEKGGQIWQIAAAVATIKRF